MSSGAARVWCWVTIAACAPYVTLKLLWLSKVEVGLSDPTLINSPTYIVANTVTFLLDLVVVALALAMTYPWGRRLPRWLITLPTTVGLGLLLPLMVTLLGVGIVTLTGDSSSSEIETVPAAQFLAPWVFAVVYSGFVVQGVGLLVLLLRYLRRTGTAVSRGTSAPLVAITSVLISAAVFTLIPLPWLGLPILHNANAIPLSQGMLSWVIAAFSAAGVAALWRIARLRRPGVRTALVAAIGCASATGWGLYMTAVGSAIPAGAFPGTTPLGTIVLALGALGALVGVTTAIRTLGTRAPREDTS